ncbi:hypothetical protein [Lutimonas zeaxanthinifaciens]|uniref:hypothetical protein n=1 Tax=Lutimonas zeaxanthinifaciens TaxID=3060215 RepID=UPI00265C91AA|nr:hypothetical protein [Lutimonas sp. YSD2104]WKK64950.1 hypothetical protein QZH61_10190 [Lutimonas sp. YSD2104]
MLKRSIYLFSFLCIIGYGSAMAQEHDSHKSSSNDHATHHVEHKKHAISASVNHTMIFNALKDGENPANITLPSFGLNYTYMINEKWRIGLHSDIIIEDFVVKESAATTLNDDHDGGDIRGIERGTPIASCIVGIYKPLPYLGLLAGFGREFSSHEDFTVVRFGIEAPYHLPNNWELFGVVTYDINIDAYQSLTYGVGFGKLF